MSVEEKRGQYVFTWKIENYSTCYLTRGNSISSPIFCVESLSGTKWQLHFYPKGFSTLAPTENFASMQLLWLQSGALSKTPIINLSLEIVHERGSVLKCISHSKEFTYNSHSLVFAKFLAIDELVSYMNDFKEDLLTLRCRMKCEKQILYEPVARSAFNVNRCCADWCVKMPFLSGYSEHISFEVPGACNLGVTLTSSLEFVTIFINLKESKLQLPVQTSFKISFHGKLNTMVFNRVGHLFMSLEEWQFPTFITRKMLEDCKINSTHFEFKLECEVKVSKKSASPSFIEKHKFTTSACFDSIEADSTISTMQNNFRTLFTSQKYSDTTIKVESEDFPVHKLVLRVQSPVFAAMFDQNMQENHNGIVNITDVDRKTMKCFLQYLYTESVDEWDYESAKKLLLVADKYEVLSLVTKCVSYLKSILSIENVCEIIAIAHSVNADNLKSFGISFVKANAAAILPTPEWSEWVEGNIKLATLILCQLSVDLSSKC